jgi:hypothetical protein
MKAYVGVKYSSILLLPRHKIEINSHLHASAPLSSGKEPPSTNWTGSGELRSRSGCFGEEKNPLSLQAIKPQIVKHEAYSISGSYILVINP